MLTLCRKVSELLRKHPVRAPAQVRNKGAILVILTTAAQLALGICLSKLEAPMLFDSQWQITALSVFNSIIANAPDALLFVALALLTAEFSGEGDGERGSNIRELLTRLRPMHFDKNEEPPLGEG
jgi:hypothetical protein